LRGKKQLRAKVLPIAISFVALLRVTDAPAGSDVIRNGDAGWQANDNLDQPMLVMTPTGNLREAPRLQSKVLAILPRGSQVTIIGNGGGWAHVTVDGREGYMDPVQLRRAPQQSVGEWTARYKEMQVALESATVNLGPTTGSRILLTLPPWITGDGNSHGQGLGTRSRLRLRWLHEPRLAFRGTRALHSCE